MHIILILIASLIVIIGVLSRPAEVEEQPPVVTPAQTPTSTPMVTPTPKPTDAPSQNFQYPTSRIVTQNETSLTLESTDDADAITSWYKEKIKTMGMNTKSFVTTKTNGNVKNVLVGASGKTEIRVEITKSASQNSVRIVVTYHTP